MKIFQIWSIFFLLTGIALIAIFNFYQLIMLENIYLIILCSFMLSWISVESAFRLPNNPPFKALSIEDVIPGVIFILSITFIIFLDLKVSISFLYFLSLIPSMVFVVICRLKNINFNKLDWQNDFLPTFRKNFSFFLINASQVTNSHGALLLLGFISSSTFIGAYRFSLAIISICSIVSSSLVTELQRIASQYEFSEMIKKKDQFTLINFIISCLMLFVLTIFYNLQFLFDSLNIDTMIKITIMLNLILIIKSLFGFPDPILISRNEESYISRIFILNAFVFFGVSILYLTLGGLSAYLVILMIALIQPSTIIFYSKYLYHKYNISSFINFKLNN